MQRLRLFDQLLKRPAIRASLWTFGGHGASQVIRLLANLILTRLLFPEAFGLMAIVSVVLAGLANFSDVGTRFAVIQSDRGEDPAFLNTAWSVQIIRGFCLWAAMCILAWPVSRLYGEPILFSLLCAAGSTAAIAGFESMAIATANRKLWLGRITIIAVCNQVLSIIVTIVLAWMYQSVWALVAGNVIGKVVGTTLGHLAMPWHRHAFRIEKEALGSLFRFGRWIFLTTLTTFLGQQGIRALQGILVSTATLGVISVAGTFSTAINEIANKLMFSVWMPRLAAVGREAPEQFLLKYRRIRRYTLMAAIPVPLCLAFLATPLINFLYDDRYAAAGRYLAIMAINAAISLIPMLYYVAFLARGNSRTPMLFLSVGTIAKIVALFVGFRLGGVEGMLFGNGIGDLVYYAAAALVSVRAGWVDLKADLLAFLAIGIATAGIFTFTT